MSKKANNIGKLIVELLLESVIIVERNNFKGVVFTYGGEIICCINYLNEFMMLREIYDKLNSRLTLEAKREIIVTTFMGYEIKIVKEDAFRKYLRPTTKPYFLHEDWIL